MDHKIERTFILVKPDGVQRGLIGKIISRFEEKGFQLVALKFVQVSENTLAQHYEEHKGKPFYNGLIEFMLSGPVCAMIWKGGRVVEAARKMLGETDPFKSAPGTIRGDFCACVGRNICHGSDSPQSSEREIAIWFNDDEIVDFRQDASKWIYE